jgi:hypothetical protein
MPVNISATMEQLGNDTQYWPRSHADTMENAAKQSSAGKMSGLTNRYYKDGTAFRQGIVYYLYTRSTLARDEQHSLLSLNVQFCPSPQSGCAAV